MFSPGSEFTAQWLQLFQQETMESLLVPKMRIFPLPGLEEQFPVLQMSSNVSVMSHGLVFFILLELFWPPTHPNGSQWKNIYKSSSCLKTFGKGPCRKPQSTRRNQICLWGLSIAPRTVATLPAVAQPLPVFWVLHRDALSTDYSLPTTRIMLWAFQVNLLSGEWLH